MNAIDQLLIEHIDIWTAADTEKKSGRGRSSGNAASVYGIKKLRELILELAVRGKLVPQDLNDEPASELLKRIQAEKAKLIAEGKIKKDKPLPQITEEEKPLFLPNGWELASVSTLTLLITDGTHHTPKYQDNGVPFISVKDINGNTVSFADCKYISEKEHLEINSRCNPERDDILLCRIGTLGRPTIVDTDRSFSLFVSVGLLKLPKTVKLSRYFHFVLSSPLMYSQYDKIKAGGIHTNKLNLGDIPRLVVPIPPIAEQHRIVAKVDELMALCDQLENQHSNAAEAHAKLVSHLLGTLTQSQSAEDFSANWQRIAAHFDTLFTTESSVDALKQTLLQLAVMGKLVPQDPNDEPASELLKRKVSMSHENIPFQIPNSWVWACVEEFAQTRLGKMLDKAKNKGSLVRYLRNVNVRWFDFDLSDVKEMRFEDSELEEFSLRRGDVLICEGGYPGRAAVWDERESNIYFQKAIHRVRFPNEINPYYFVNVLRESADSRRLNSYFTGAGIQHFTGKGLMSFLVPLPPLAEQHRIVAKVDELMALCDALKTRINQAQSIQIHLADTIVNQALV
jgi:type I restriction enzyme S subunit